jgi:hypothetical protein
MTRSKKAVQGRHISEAVAAELERRIRAGEVPSHAADALGVGRRSAYRIAARIRTEMPDEQPEAPEAEAAGAFRLGGSAADRRVVALEDEVKRLRKELRDVHRAELTEESVRGILGRMAVAPTEPPEWLLSPPKGKANRTPEVPATIFSDWHLGEVVSRAETNGLNVYDLETAEARVRRLVEAIIHLCRNHGPGRYPGFVLNLLGDFVSGGLHPELAKTDAEESIPSALRARDLLVWCIETLAAEFGRIYVPCASGNHGRATPKPEHKRYVFKNYDWLIYQLLARHFEGRKDIHFDIPESNEVYYRIYNQRYLAMHGDQLGVKGGDGIIGAIGPIMRGEVKTRGQATSSGRDYDILLMGHWHQELWLPRAIVANSIKGFDEFAKNVLRAPPSEPSQPLWFVHPRRGITSRWSVKVEEPRSAEGAGWVSWPGRNAA